MCPNCRQLERPGWRAEYFYSMACVRCCGAASLLLLPWEWSGLPPATTGHPTGRVRRTQPTRGLAVAFLTQGLQSTVLFGCVERLLPHRKILMQVLNHLSNSIIPCDVEVAIPQILIYCFKDRFFLFASWFVTFALQIWEIARYLVLSGSWDKDLVPGIVFKKNPKYCRIYSELPTIPNLIRFIMS